MGFRHHIRIYNKTFPADSDYLHTQHHTRDFLELTQRSHGMGTRVLE